MDIELAAECLAAVLAFALLIMIPLFLLHHVLRGMTNALRLRSGGIRVSGTSLSVVFKQHESTNSDGSHSTWKSFHTLVRFDDERDVTHTKLVDGAFTAGSEVPMIFHPGKPLSALPASDTRAVRLIIGLILVIFILCVSTIGFFVTLSIVRDVVFGGQP